jgi:hypothetical protein
MIKLLMFGALAQAQVLTWEPPVGDGDKYEVKGYRLSYEIFAPDEECVEVETNYWLDMGLVNTYKMHEDINFRPGFWYYFKIQTYTDRADSKLSDAGYCVQVRGVPNAPINDYIDDDYHGGSILKKGENNNEEDIYIASSDMPGTDSLGGSSDSDVGAGEFDNYGRADRDIELPIVLGRTGPGSGSSYRVRSAGADRTSKRSKIQVSSDTKQRGMDRRKHVLLSDDSVKDIGQHGARISTISAGLQDLGANRPKGSDNHRVRVILIVLGLLAILGALFGISTKKA